MYFRHFSEGHEIMKIKWIIGSTNQANAMTKAKPCRAFQNLIEISTINLKTKAWK